MIIQGDCMLNSNISKKGANHPQTPSRGELYLFVVKNKFLKYWNLAEQRPSELTRNRPGDNYRKSLQDLSLVYSGNIRIYQNRYCAIINFPTCSTEVFE